MNLIVITKTDGKCVFINPKNILSISKGEDHKATTINYKNGGVFVVKETPEQLNKLIEELNQ